MKGMKCLFMLWPVLFLVSCTLSTPDLGNLKSAGQSHFQSLAYDPGSGWNLAWSDEFNSINTSVWNQEVRSDGCGNNELEAYTASANNSYISNGILVIKAIKETVSGKPFSSARLNTFGKFSFRYGKIAARIQTPYGYGLWPAFWLMGSGFNGNNWPYVGEIDIMEMAGDGGFMDKVEWATCHWYNNDPTYTGVADYGLRYTNSARLADDYHVYEIEWDTNYITARFDGIQFYQIYTGTNKSLATFQFPMCILLNVAVGGAGIFTPPVSDPNTVTACPQTMNVDWIRVYSPKFSLPAENGNQNIAVNTETHTGVDVYAKGGTVDLWASTCSMDSNAAGAAEGSKCWKVTTGSIGWMGFGVSTIAWGHNLANHSGSTLNFKIKTTSASGYKVGIKSGSVTEAWVNLNFTRDGNWQTVSIPMSSFSGIDFSMISQYFMFASTTGTTTGDAIYVDDIYWASTGINASSISSSASSISSSSSSAVISSSSSSSSSSLSSSKSSSLSSGSSSSVTGSYTAGADKTGSSTVQIWFKPTAACNYTDVHYTVNNGLQQNVRTAYNSSTARYEQNVSGLADGNTITYSFTYQTSDGTQHDTAAYTYTFSSSSSSSSSSFSSSAASSSSSSGAAISLPGTVTTSVGPIANGSTITWNVTLTRAGNYRVMPTFAGTQTSQVIVTFQGRPVTINANPGQVPYIDFANCTAGAATLSIKATTAGVNIGNLSVTTY